MTVTGKIFEGLINGTMKVTQIAISTPEGSKTFDQVDYPLMVSELRTQNQLSNRSMPSAMYGAV